jgi:hypothetical protein
VTIYELDLSMGLPCQHAGRKLAFLVGVREYKHLEFRDLDFPENDVEDFAVILNARGFKTVVLTTARGKKASALASTAENLENRGN